MASAGITTVDAREAVLRCIDRAFFGRTDAQAAAQWQNAVSAVDGLIAAVRAERDAVKR